MGFQNDENPNFEILGNFDTLDLEVLGPGKYDIWVSPQG
jgi:hypothetical protein